MDNHIATFKHQYDENRIFKETLDYFFPITDINPHDINFILNIGCGKCREGDVLASYFPNSKILGIDIDEDEIIAAREENTSDRIHFKCISAKHLEKKIDQKADLVILRHPNSHEVGSKDLFAKCYEYTKDTGIFFSTFYGNQDYYAGTDLIKDVGYRLLSSDENPCATFTSKRELFSAAFCDGYVTVGIKDEKKEGLFEKIINKFNL